MIKGLKHNIKSYPFTLKKGQKFIPIANCNGHNYEIGKEYVATRNLFFNSPGHTFTLGGSLNTICVSDIHIVGGLSTKSLKERKKVIEDNIKELQKEIEYIDESLELLKELDPTGKKEVDEAHLKLTYALKKLENENKDSTIATKALVLAKLLES